MSSARRTLPPTSGALGTKLNDESTKQKSSSSSKHQKLSKVRERTPPPVNTPPVENVRPLHVDNLPPPKEHLAGAPDLQKRSELGVRSSTVKSVELYNVGATDPNRDSEIRFVVRSNAFEYIRFKPSALTTVIYTQFLNPDYQANHADERRATEFVSTRLYTDRLFLLIDPDVGGMGFLPKLR